MKSWIGFSSCLFVLVVAGCASTKVSDREILVTEKLARPHHIWVYDFYATPNEVPSDSAIAGSIAEHPTPQTPEQIKAGRELGAQIAARLVEEIRAMGLPAQHASFSTKPKVNDLVIRGHLLSIVEGSAAKRVAIGFGSGASSVKAAAEGYQVTAMGMRKLGSGSVDAGGSSTPGAGLGAAAMIATANPAGLIVSTGMKAYGEYSGSSKVEGRGKDIAKEIAERIKPRFQEQGWIE